MAKEVGILTEQGDLGLGFNPLNEPDAKAYAEATEKKEAAPETVVVNEENK